MERAVIFLLLSIIEITFFCFLSFIWSKV